MLLLSLLELGQLGLVVRGFLGVVVREARVASLSAHVSNRQHTVGFLAWWFMKLESPPYNSAVRAFSVFMFR